MFLKPQVDDFGGLFSPSIFKGEHVLLSAESWLKRGAGSCNFLPDSCKCPKEEIMGAHNFNFAFKRPNVSKFIIAMLNKKTKTKM